MKNLLFAILLLISYSGYNQRAFNELPDNQRERYKIINIFPDGLILAYTDYPYNLYMSTDLGESWNLVETNGQIIRSNSFFSAHVGLDGLNYFSYREVIFQIDKDMNVLVPVFELEEYGYIEDFNFLPNGNLVVAESRSFRLYNENFQLIKELDWWTHSADILIGQDGKHYVTNSHGASYSILEFNDNIELSEEIAIPSSQSFYFINGRIYADRRYSNDGGVTWENYISVNSSYTSLYAVSENRLLLDAGSEILLSYDSGENLILVKSDFSSNPSSGFLHSGNAITMYSNTYENGEATLSTTYDNGDTYIHNNMNLGQEYSLSVEVDDAGYAFTSYLGKYSRYNPISGEWNSYSDEDCQIGSSQVMALANSTIISDFGCMSKDHGESWEYVGGLYFGLYYIKDKNECLFDLDYIFRKSCDFGLSWQDIPYLEYSFDYEYTDVTGEGNIITYNGFFEGPIAVIHYEDGTTEEIDFDYNIQHFFTAYSGPTVYLVTTIGNERVLFVSHSGYDNFTPIDLPPIEFDTRKIYIDYLNNLYFYDDKKLFVSKDEGNTWEDISPTHPDVLEITDVELGYDLHLYISTIGTSVLKSKEPIKQANKLEVVVFEDTNENCQFDEGEESLIDGFRITLNDKFTKESRITGPLSFSLIGNENLLEVEVDESLYSICDFDKNVIFTETTTELIQYIPVSIIRVCPELEINASTPLLRRCFDNEYTLEVQNNGTDKATGVIVNVELDEYFEFISSTGEILSTNGQKIVIGLNHIDRNKKEKLKIKFKLSCDAELGQAHYMNANIAFDNSCSGVELTEAFECRENIGSYDPNDKTTLVDGVANTKIIAADETVEYLIRFQNTGTDTAFTVKVEDQIVSLYEQSSLQVVASSHDFEYSIDRGVASFLFNNILLPDSTTNEKASHGFVKFKVKIQENTKPGDFLLNSADIYFDFNAPIKTNTTVNYFICKHQTVSIDDTICFGESSYGFEESGTYYDFDAQSTLGCDSNWILYLTVLDELDVACMPLSSKDESLSYDITLFPNPTSGQVFFDTEDQILSIVNLLDVQGRRLNTLKIDGNSVDLDVVSGVYFLEMVSSEGWKDIQKVIVIE